MTIKTHIAISATISLALIALIACQQRAQAPKEQPKAVSEQKAKAEEVMKNFEQEAKAETEKLETKVEKAAKEFNDIAKEAEDKDKEETKEIETKVDEAAKKIESEVETIEGKIEGTIESKEKQDPQNLLLNGDFNEGLTSWQTTKGVKIIQEDDKNIVEITGLSDGQNRIWQELSTVSGHVYKISFNVKAEKGTAFVIWRDHQANRESYFYTMPSLKWKNYTKEFQSKKDGKYMIFLSTVGEGLYYYSDINLIDLNAAE